MASDLVPAFVELRRLHAEAVSNAGGDFEVDCDEALRIFCMKNVPALLDAAERCAAAEAQAKAAGELLRNLREVHEKLAVGMGAFKSEACQLFSALLSMHNLGPKDLGAAERAGVKP